MEAGSEATNIGKSAECKPRFRTNSVVKDCLQTAELLFLWNKIYVVI